MTHRKGFTLIELLVVISIIALLISILLPALREVRELAKLTTCQVRQRQISIALSSYATDENGQMPPCISRNNVGWTYPYRINYRATDPNTRYDTGSVIPHLRPYSSDPLILQCPLTPEVPAFVDALKADWANFNNVSSPYLAGGYFFLWGFHGFASDVEFASVDSLEDSGDGLVTSDVYITNDSPGNQATSHPNEVLPEFLSWQHPRYYGSMALPNPKNMTLNSGYIDGHVETHRPDEMYQLPLLFAELTLPIAQY